MFFKRLKTSFFLFLFALFLYYAPLWIFLTISFSIWRFAAKELNSLVNKETYPYLWKLYLWISFFMLFWITLKYNSQVFVFYLFGIAIAHDIGGYIGGKLFGKHKLAPIISPNKTWEGLFSSFLFILTYIFIFKPVNSTLHIFIVSIILTLLCLMGDLSISYLKRRTGVKDTGNLLEAHGGILDRLDSALPLFFFILLFTFFMI
jgi:phosphatidate cytidylyltransferase